METCIFGVMVLFFKLIVIILFKKDTRKWDFEKLKFSPFDMQNIVLNNKINGQGNFLTQISFLIQFISTMKRLNQNVVAVMTSPFKYFILI